MKTPDFFIRYSQRQFRRDAWNSLLTFLITIWAVQTVAHHPSTLGKICVLVDIVLFGINLWLSLRGAFLAGKLSVYNETENFKKWISSNEHSN